MSLVSAGRFVGRTAGTVVRASRGLGLPSKSRLTQFLAYKATRRVLLPVLGVAGGSLAYASLGGHLNAKMRFGKTHMRGFIKGREVGADERGHKVFRLGGKGGVTLDHPKVRLGLIAGNGFAKNAHVTGNIKGISYIRSKPFSASLGMKFRERTVPKPLRLEVRGGS